MKHTKELFDTVSALDEADHGDFSIHLTSERMNFANEATFRIYHSNGYCFEIERQQHCESDEVADYINDIHNLQPDGATYHYSDCSIQFDGFKIIKVDSALTLIKKATP